MMRSLKHSHPQLQRALMWLRRHPIVLVPMALCTYVTYYLLYSWVMQSGSLYRTWQCLFKSFASVDEAVKSGRVFDNVSHVLADDYYRASFASVAFPTDKDARHNYTVMYDHLVAPYRDSAKAVLEVGIKKGGSIRLWREFFSWDCYVYGIDIDPGVPTFVRDGHVKSLIMDSRNEEQVSTALKGLTFDVIVDDGLHTRAGILSTFMSLHSFLSPDGVYLMEDVPASKALRLGGEVQAIMPELTVAVYPDRSLLSERRELLLALFPPNSRALSRARAVYGKIYPPGSLKN